MYLLRARTVSEASDLMGSVCFLGFLRVDLQFYSPAVTKKPKSGKPEKLLDYEGISSRAIIEAVKEKLR